MFVNKVKYHAYNLAIRSDPQEGTLNVRQVTNTIGQQDQFTSYNLTRITYRPPTDQELELVQANLNDVFVVWIITQWDLDLVSSPPPEITYTMNVADNLWTIERATKVALLQVYECLCRRVPPIET